MKLAIAIIAATVLCILLLAGFYHQTFKRSVLLSSSTSPNGLWIARNFLDNDDYGGGFITIQKTNERPISIDAPITSKSSEPDVFLIWKDDSHLSVFRPGYLGPLTGPDSYRGIEILYSTYDTGNRKSDNHAPYPEKEIGIERDRVSADFSQEVVPRGKRCNLTISATDGVAYRKLGMKIVASVNSCGMPHYCAGMNSRFWLDERVDGRSSVALTSATVADIPSYIGIPEGEGNRTVRGQFLEVNAVNLVHRIDAEYVDIRYSLNFSEQVILYRVPTAQIKKSIDGFLACIDHADFNWLNSPDRKKS